MPNEFISREVFAEYLCDEIATSMADGANEAAIALIETLVKLRAIPPADVAPVVHARWWPDNMDAGCSVCGGGMPRNPDGSQDESDYCPNCGAKMDGGDRNAD